MQSKSYSARTLDAKALKSFAHPLRLRLYELLDEHGPSTATRLAALLEQNTGATSYHLRELARHGMIETAPELGKGKEKYWRIVPGGFTYGEPPQDDPEAASAFAFLIDDLIRQRGAELARWRAEATTTPEEWVQASGFGRRSLRLTAQEAVDMRNEVLEVLDRYRVMADRRQERSGGSPDPLLGHVVVHFDTFPVGASDGPGDGPGDGSGGGPGGDGPGVGSGDGLGDGPG
ncbi:helix-turn-helix domain-containing protein [Nonomuraea sp. NPDC050691]|uniref:ArsR/SmtB family transcription factor n=1 Tax=Nonomuraea sp. NPDC050691 TaxID=3155661 RepID=UPI0033EE95A0